jgi:hypothetical protein
LNFFFKFLGIDNFFLEERAELQTATPAVVSTPPDMHDSNQEDDNDDNVEYDDYDDYKLLTLMPTDTIVNFEKESNDFFNSRF